MSEEKTTEQLIKEFKERGGKIHQCPKELSPAEERRKKQLKKELKL